MNKEEFMNKAIRLSIANIANGGGPFGAIIVRGDIILASGVNKVIEYNDPTAHAEIIAIRQACTILNTHSLKGCEIYTSCEPCPMCFAAIHWARIDKIYYACTKEDAAKAGFIDCDIYEQLSLPENKRIIPSEQLMQDTAIEAFTIWNSKSDKQTY